MNSTKGQTMKSVKILSTLGMFVGLCLSSQATILLPGQTGLDAPQAPGPTPALATLVTSYAVDGIVGTITSWVVKDPANPLGGLSFYYQIDEAGTEPIGRVTAANFGLTPGSPVEVSTLASPFANSLPGGVVPTTATRSTGPGSTVGFNFTGIEVQPGQHSVVLVVNTAYNSFQVSNGAIIDSSAVNVAILGPVPEPSSIMAASLLLIPLGASTLRIVRKR
jgi:hypothetical protein